MFFRVSTLPDVNLHWYLEGRHRITFLVDLRLLQCLALSSGCSITFLELNIGCRSNQAAAPSFTDLTVHHRDWLIYGPQSKPYCLSIPDSSRCSCYQEPHWMGQPVSSVSIVSDKTTTYNDKSSVILYNSSHPFGSQLSVSFFSLFDNVTYSLPKKTTPKSLFSLFQEVA